MGSDSAFGEPNYAAPAAPLEKAVEILRDDLRYVDADHVEHDAGSDAADVIRSAEALLAALDADKRLEEAEKLLREVASSGVEFDDERISYTSVQIDRETWAGVRRYFARREDEKGENRGH